MGDIADPKVLIEAKRLLLSSPEEVYRYFENLNDENMSYQLSFVLADSGNELIKLALAKYSKNSNVVEKLFNENKDETIRCAALLNPDFPLGSFGAISLKHTPLVKILEEGTDAETYALVTNKSLKGETLACIFDKRGWAEKLSDERWFLCSIYALDNPNLHEDYKSISPVGYDEGWQDYSHSEAISAAWNLLIKAPLTEQWAIGLVHQITKLHAKIADETFYKYVFDRWRSNNNDLEKAFKKLRMWVASTVPAYLDKLHQWMANHEDQSIRVGHYYSFKTFDKATLDEYYKKDGKEFIGAALLNENLFMTTIIRNHFRKIVEGNCEQRNDYAEMDYFDIMVEKLSKAYPDAFAEDE
ncbi:MAG: hypothetical protein Q8J64_02660 [Thermodesulfovibrionales bacterium]|nr:hypothetical protein [Thermodesulfovibrionales bacterium]